MDRDRFEDFLASHCIELEEQFMKENQGRFEEFAIRKFQGDRISEAERLEDR